MNNALSIRTWTEPFPNYHGVAVVFDIFRCSTTVHHLAARAQGPLFVAPSLAEAAKSPRSLEMRVFSELSQPIDCAERYDNSPKQAIEQEWSPGRAALVATTTGTPAMFAAQKFDQVFVGSLVNFSALVAALSNLDCPITLIPAALPSWQHVEDEIACQAVATALEGFANVPEFVKQCGDLARERILASPRPQILAGKLATGVEDVRLALEIDKLPQILTLDFATSGESTFAEVKKVN